jgi:ribosomal protein L11 methyltransferase
MSASAQTSAFHCVRVVTTPERAERVAAEAFAAGASGLEERERGARIELLVYAPADRADAVTAAARAHAGADARVDVEPVAPCDWPETWKQGLRPVVVSPRLVVRPPFAAREGPPGAREVVIEPRQAFGTGAHGSTALALALLDARLAAGPAARVLDVGSGSGVLAIAALRLGAGRAVACDLDPIAARETRENATRNGVAAGITVFAGSLAALGPRAGAFDLVVANLLSSELRPILPALAARVAPGGAAVLSGLLAAEHAAIAAALAAHGLRVVGERRAEDARGDDWLALTAVR